MDSSKLIITLVILTLLCYKNSIAQSIYNNRASSSKGRAAELLLYNAFKALDKHKMNFLFSHEFRQALPALIDEDYDFDEIFKSFDFNNDRKINFQEFSQILNYIHPSSVENLETLVQEIFAAYEFNNLGFIAADEFLDFILSSDTDNKVGNSMIDIVQLADTDSSGTINYDEFYTILKKLDNIRF